MVAPSKLMRTFVIGAAVAAGLSTVPPATSDTGINVTAVVLDEHDRWFIFTKNANCTANSPNDTLVRGNSNHTFNIEYLWEGQFRTVMEGQKWEEPAVIAEMSVHKYDNQTFFDVSAVDNHTDNTGVHHLYPTITNKTDPEHHSGCYNFPCPNVYLYSEDPQTRTDTQETEFICEVGGHPSTFTEADKKVRGDGPTLEMMIEADLALKREGKH